MSSAGTASDGQEATGAEQGPLFSLALRGGSLDLWHDRIMLGSATDLLGELVQAVLVPYPADAPGALALGVLRQTRDGRAPLLIPEDTASAQRFLGKIYARRPDLRMPYPWFPPLNPPQYAAHPAQPPQYRLRHLWRCAKLSREAIPLSTSWQAVIYTSATRRCAGVWH